MHRNAQTGLESRGYGRLSSHPMDWQTQQPSSSKFPIASHKKAHSRTPVEVVDFGQAIRDRRYLCFAMMQETAHLTSSGSMLKKRSNNEEARAVTDLAIPCQENPCREFVGLVLLHARCCHGSGVWSAAAGEAQAWGRCLFRAAETFSNGVAASFRQLSWLPCMRKFVACAQSEGGRKAAARASESSWVQEICYNADSCASREALCPGQARKERCPQGRVCAVSQERRSIPGDSETASAQQGSLQEGLGSCPCATIPCKAGRGGAVTQGVPVGLVSSRSSSPEFSHEAVGLKNHCHTPGQRRGKTSCSCHCLRQAHATSFWHAGMFDYDRRTS